MTKLQYKSISRRTVEALSVAKDTVFWDNELTGFGVRVYPSGARVYVVQSRGPSGLKRVTVGRHGVISADQARRRAALILARIKAGEDPAAAPLGVEPGPAVADLAERYYREYVAVRCKPGTAQVVPSCGAQAHSARVRRAGRYRGRARACDRPALPAAPCGRPWRTR